MDKKELEMISIGKCKKCGSKRLSNRIRGWVNHTVCLDCGYSEVDGKGY